MQIFQGAANRRMWIMNAVTGTIGTFVCCLSTAASGCRLGKTALCRFSRHTMGWCGWRDIFSRQWNLRSAVNVQGFRGGSSCPPSPLHRDMAGLSGPAYFLGRQAWRAVLEDLGRRANTARPTVLIAEAVAARRGGPSRMLLQSDPPDLAVTEMRNRSCDPSLASIGKSAAARERGPFPNLRWRTRHESLVLARQERHPLRGR
jgi:hypothetical protein